jgi:two-component system, NtrC family, response regulator AtoC
MRGSLTESTIVSTSKTEGGDVVHVPQRLTIGTGQSVATHLLPPEGTLTVGRSPEASIRVDDTSVSRQHVRLHLGAMVHIEDLGSANGTKIAGARLPAHERKPLPPGQVAEIGASWMMVSNAPLARSTTQQMNTQMPAPIEVTPPPVIRSAAVAAPDDGLVVHDQARRNLHKLIERAALSDIAVLLLGETGVGKEVFARRLHALSPRASRPFLGLNCAAVAPSLFESELFGHERGAFTGATQTKLGLLEAAEGGTVLLDEVGEMPLAIQVKLLRVLEERQVLRIGGTKPRAINVRLLSATNRNLEAEVEAGAFRRDLYFRLNSISVQIPPLRERLPEIEPLARRFVLLAAERLGVAVPEIDAAVWDRLRARRWPGNIRELRNVMERAVVLSDHGRITTNALPAETELASGPEPYAPTSSAGAPAGATLANVRGDSERQRILDALEACAGNQTRAAEMLGIARRTLLNRLAEYDLPRPRKRGKP